MKTIQLFIVLTGIGSIWGLSVPISKIAVSTGHQPLGIMFWQLLITIGVLGAICFIRKIRIYTNADVLKFCLLLGLLGSLLPNYFFYLTIAQLPAGVSAIILALVPMSALLISLTIGLEAFTTFRMLGVLAGILAIIILVGPKTSLPDPDKAIFVLIALLSPICYGLESILVAIKKPRRSEPVATVFLASVITIIIVTPLMFASNQWVDLFQSWGIAETAVVGNALIHAMAYAGYVWLIGASGPVFSSQVAYIVTITGVFFSIWLLGESYSGWIWAALTLTIIGLFLVKPQQNSHPEELQYTQP